MEYFDEGQENVEYEDGSYNQHDELFLGLLTVSLIDQSHTNCEINQIKKNEWIEKLKVGNIQFDVKVDTGAQAEVMSENLLYKIDPNPIIREPKVKLIAYGGNEIPT